MLQELFLELFENGDFDKRWRWFLVKKIGVISKCSKTVHEFEKWETVGEKYSSTFPGI
jgi:hypothetical protein